MIKQEKVELNGLPFIKRYSDKNVYIKSGTSKYTVAYDVPTITREYEETDIPIPPPPTPPPTPTPEPEPEPRTLELVDQELTDTQLALISLYEDVNYISEQLTSTQLALVSVYEIIKGGDTDE